VAVAPDRWLISVTELPAALAIHSCPPAASSAAGSPKPNLRPDRVAIQAPVRVSISVIESSARLATQGVRPGYGDRGWITQAVAADYPKRNRKDVYKGNEFGGRLLHLRASDHAISRPF